MEVTGEMLNGKIGYSTVEEIGIDEVSIDEDSEEDMPRKKKVRVKPYKRRKPSGTRKIIPVKGYTRSSRRKKYSVKSTRKRKKKPKKSLLDIIFGD